MRLQAVPMTKQRRDFDRAAAMMDTVPPFGEPSAGGADADAAGFIRGQVWQATDTQLSRQVALKILPDAFAADPDRLARFTRGAQVLAIGSVGAEDM